MPKRTNDFQKLITMIYQQLATQGARVTESKMIRDIVTEEEREVDIAIEDEYMGQPILIGIECRDRRRNETTEWIDSLIGKYRDLPVDKVFAVSSSGFTKSAQQRGAAHRIVTLAITEAEETAWATVVGETKPTRYLTIVTPRLVGVTYNGVSNIATLQTSGRVNVAEVTIHDSLSNVNGTALEVFDYLLGQPQFTEALQQIPSETHREIAINLSDSAYILGPTGTRHSISNVVFAVEQHQETMIVELEPGLLGQTPVAIGTGTSVGWQANMVLVKNGDKEPTLGLSVGPKVGMIGPGIVRLFGAADTLEPAPKSAIDP